ncbi:MAG TPA: ABC transporter ATP-binding protein [Planctomycetota bacterium]|nr:ABC transporter ATP-binding protein [Planctomycetota bacterium]
MTTSTLAIKTSELTMVYNPGLFAAKKVGLQGLNLEVPSGSIFGYLGQNGAGKTTTIKILMGLQFSTGGEAWILGENVRNSAARRNVGFMPENPYFYEYLTAEEALDFYGKLSGMDRDSRRTRTEQLISEFGLGHARKVQLRNFSKGMRQRLGLAQAVMHKPPLVILDEPMSGLDPLGRRDVRNVILSLRDAGQTVFFSSHILGDVEEICDRVCVLDRGKKVAEGPISSLLTGKVLEVHLAASGIAAAGLPEVSSLAIRAWHDGILYHVLVDSEDKAQKAKDLIEKAGGVLRVMQPHKESLEEYFVRVTRHDSGDSMGKPHVSAPTQPVLGPTPEARPEATEARP